MVGPFTYTDFDFFKHASAVLHNGPCLIIVGTLTGCLLQ